MKIKRIYLTILLCFFSLSASAKVLEHWRTYSPSSLTQINHTTWTQLLKSHTVSKNGNTLVTYHLFTELDKKHLSDYIHMLEQQPVSRLNQDEQKAFWINLYNALTVKTVVDHYPIKSIRKITFGKFFATGPWDKKLVRIENQALSLNDIEHGILRPIFKDPRVHYALNCASLGCPNLQKGAFTHDNLNRLLNQGARDFINSSKGVQLKNNRLITSTIYKWFSQDFGKNQAEIIEHIKQYANDELKAQLSKQHKIHDYQYNWSINADMNKQG